MKQFIFTYRKSIAWQAIQSGLILSLPVYALIRSIFYEFPMNWEEEFSFFSRIIAVGTLMIAAAMGISVLLHRSIEKIITMKK